LLQLAEFFGEVLVEDVVAILGIGGQVHLD
jgi:hypothetical protein